MSRVQTAILVAALAGSCGDRQSENRNPEPAPVPAGAPSALGRMSLMDRLVHEARSRPTARPRPEAVAAALAVRGLPLERWKQVLASPIGARFCMAGQTAAGLVVAVCEFGDEAEATAGLSFSHKTFDPIIPNRALVRRGPTVLTITTPAGAASASAQAGRVAEIFAAL
jgi:hypothetical protein